MGIISKILKPFGKALKLVFKPISKLLKKWLVPKIDQPAKNGYDVQQFGANNTIPLVYGWNYVAGTIVDMNVTDGPGAVKNEFLHVLVVFCVGPVDVAELFLDGISISDQKYSGKVEYVVRRGLDGQLSIPQAAGNFQRFDPDHSTFPGLVYAYIKLIQDGEQTTFSGVPEISAYVSGRRVANLPGRTDPFWWLNPAVCLYDYLRDPIWGAGLSDADIDLDSFNLVADKCDVLVPVTYRKFECSVTGGIYSCTESPEIISQNRPRHTISTVIDTGRSLFDNMTQIANVFRGFWPDSDGRVKIGIEQEGTAVFSFDESNIIRGSMSMNQPDVSDRFNRVTVRYQDSREVTKPFAREVSYPPPGDDQYDTWLAEDNGVPHELTIDADGIGNPWEAQQLAIVAARSSRVNLQIEFAAAPAATECDVGDIIAVTWADYGWTNKTFRISDITFNADGLVDIQAVQHENAVYPWTNLDFDDITGGSYLGDPNNPAPVESLTITPDKTFANIGKLSWVYPVNRFVRKFLVVGTLDGVEYLRVETPGNEIQLALVDIAGPTDAEWTVYAISTTGVSSPGVTTTATLDYPAAPITLNLKPANFEISAAPSIGPSEPLGTSYDIELVGTPLGVVAARTVTFNGLRSGTTYSVRARTVNAFGRSAWTTESTTTTADADPILDLIGDNLIDSIADIVLPPLLEKVDELADTYDTRELIPAGVADAFTDLDLSKEITQETTIRREQNRTLVAQLTLLQADFDTEQGVNTARYTELTTAIATETSARVTQYELLETRVGDNEASIGTTQEAVSDLEGALATQVTRIDAVTAQSSATVIRVDQAEADIAGNASAISGLRVAVAGSDSQSQAELILSATVTNASTAIARAYLGVTSVVGGVARINGIIIDGSTNRLEFRADNVLFTDTAGNPSIYFDTAGGRFVFKGDILASNIRGSSFSTNDYGYLLELKGPRPFWYGFRDGNGVETTHTEITPSGLKVQIGTIQAGMDTVGSRAFMRHPNGMPFWYGFNTTPTHENGLFSVSPVGDLRCLTVNTSTRSSMDGGLDADNSDGNPGSNGVSAKGVAFDFYASGTGTYGPFTGSHEALVHKDHETQPGQLIRDVELIASNGLSNTITRVEVCNSPACKSVVGVVVSRYPVDPDNLPAALVGFDGPLDDYDVVVFNAVGEGLLLAEGDLEPGDLLTSGAEPGVAVKQPDDIVRASTVAKCRQHLTAADGVKLVAVIYLAG